MSVTIKFKNTVGCPDQAEIIQDATSKNDGVMTKAQAAKLEGLASIWDTPVPGVNLVTVDATPTLTSVVAMPRDGVMALITNVAAATADGADWAVWLIAEAVITRINGVLTIQTPVGPQGPTANAGATSAGWKVEYTVSGDVVSMFVVGDKEATIQWSVHTAGNYNVNAGV